MGKFFLFFFIIIGVERRVAYTYTYDCVTGNMTDAYNYSRNNSICINLPYD